MLIFKELCVLKSHFLRHFREKKSLFNVKLQIVWQKSYDKLVHKLRNIHTEKVTWSLVTFSMTLMSEKKKKYIIY